MDFLSLKKDYENSYLCGYDVKDCKKNEACYQGTNCYSFYALFEYAANVVTDDSIISQQELCFVWPYIKDQIDAPNCTETSFIDINNDGSFSYYEMLSASNDFIGISKEKALQLDCSHCLTDPDDYF